MRILIAIISSSVIEANDELIEIYWKGLNDKILSVNNNYLKRKMLMTEYRIPVS